MYFIVSKTLQGHRRVGGCLENKQCGWFCILQSESNIEMYQSIPSLVYLKMSNIGSWTVWH